MSESEEELKSVLGKEKEESENVGLKLNIQEANIMASCPITPRQIDGETMETERDLLFGAQKSLQMVSAIMKIKMLAPWKKSYDLPRQHVKKQRHYFTHKGPSIQSYVFFFFSSGYVVWI